MKNFISKNSIVIISILIFSISSFAELIEDSHRSQTLPFMDINNPIESVRHQNYVNIVCNEINDFDAEELRVRTEAGNGTIGRIARLEQLYNGLPVFGAFVTVRVQSSSKADYLFYKYHKNIGLSNESYLSIADDQSALINYASSIITDPIYKSISHVAPLVYPIYNEVSGIWSYCYALRVFPTNGAPSRIYDWETGFLYFEDQHDALEQISGVVRTYHTEYPDMTEIPELCDRCCTVEIENEGGANQSTCPNEDGHYYLDAAETFTLKPRADNNKVKIYRTLNYNNGDWEWQHLWEWRWGPQTDPDPNLNYAIRFRQTNVGADLDDVNAMYWMNKIGWWFHDNLNIQDVKVQVGTGESADIRNGCSPYFHNGITSKVTLGREATRLTLGHPQMWARWQTVCHHEWAHALQHRIFGGSMRNFGNEGGSIGEGTADWIGVFLDGGHVVSPLPRRTNNTQMRYSYVLPGDRVDFQFWLTNGIRNQTYTPYPNPDLYAGGCILSGAMTDLSTTLRSWNMVPSGYNSAEEYVLWLITQSLFAHSISFDSFADRLVEIDDTDGDMTNERAELLYNVLWERHGMYSPHFGYFMENGSGLYQAEPRGMISSSSFPLGKNSGSNTITSTRDGLFIVHIDEDRVVLSHSVDDGENWQQWWLSDDIHTASNPSLSGRVMDGTTYLHVAWNDDENGVVLTEVLVQSNAENGVYAIEVELPRLPNDEGVQFTPPTVISGDKDYAQGWQTHPTLMVGISGTQNSNGIHYWTAPDYELGGVWFHGIVDGSESHDIVETTFYLPDGSKDPKVVWLTSDERIFYRQGRSPQGVAEGYEWFGDVVEITDIMSGYSSPSNIGITSSYDIRGTAVVFEAQNLQTGYSDILCRFAEGQTGYPPPPDVWRSDYSFISLDDCGDLSNPSINPYTTKAEQVPDGNARFVIGYERKMRNQSDKSVEIRGLRIDEDHPYNSQFWIWMDPRTIGHGFTPKTHKVHMNNDQVSRYAIVFARDEGAFNASLLFEHHSITFGVSNPPPPIPPDRPVSRTEVITPPFTTDRNIVIESGGTLDMIPDPDQACGPPIVRFLDNARIIVHPGGKLNITGTPNNHIILESYEDGNSWDGIELDGGQLKMDWVEMYDTGSRAVTAKNPVKLGGSYPVEITNCIFDGGGLLMGNNPKDALKLSNVTIRDVPGNEGLYLFNCFTNCTSVNVLNCPGINTYLKKVSGLFSGCNFEGRTEKQGVFLNTETCNPAFVCCQFTNLAPTGTSPSASVYSAIGCNPVFGKYQSDQASNVFMDDSDFLLAFSGGKGPLPVLDERPNDFYQLNAKTGKYMLWEKYPVPPQAPYQISGLYWKSGFDIKYFEPEDLNYWKIGSEASNPYGVCGSGQASREPGPFAGGRGVSLDEDSLIVDTLSYAIGLEQDEQFAEAQGLYLYVIDHALDESTIWTAASRVVTSDVHLENSGTWIPALLTGLIEDYDNSYNAVLHGKRILANYYLNHEDYSTAIDICNELLADSLAFDDSIFVATDLIGIQIAAGLIDWEDGSLDGNFSSAVPKGLQVTSLEQGITLERELLDLLGTLDGDKTPSRSRTIPTEFALYQNYPNPFNPTTQIRYDVPEAVRVKINVYNTLGQFVTQLQDGVQAAGAYSVVWDGKSTNGVDVATGMYIFRMEASNFTSTKKMLLLK